MDEKFDYVKAMARLEEMAAAAQDPATPLEDVGAMVKESKVLVKQCRSYLRTLKETIDSQEDDLRK